MTLSQRHVEDTTQAIAQAFDGYLTWRWEDNHKSMLSEFARNKKDKTLAILRQQFDHEWTKKSIKSAPKILKEQLGQLTELSKDQILFTRPGSGESPTIIAIWWPWGHGATVSLRLTLVKDSYKLPEPINNKDNFFTVVKKLFS